MGLIYFIIFAVVVVVLIQNYYAFTQVISLAFYHIRGFAFPLGLWFLIIFSIGFLVGYLIAVPAQVKSFTRSREISKLKKRIEELEKENQEKTERIRLMESQILNEKIEIERTEKPITIENVNPVKNPEQQSSDK